MVMGITGYKGWNGVIEAFAKVWCGHAWPCKDGGNESDGYLGNGYVV